VGKGRGGKKKKKRKRGGGEDKGEVELCPFLIDYSVSVSLNAVESNENGKWGKKKERRKNEEREKKEKGRKTKKKIPNAVFPYLHAFQYPNAVRWLNAARQDGRRRKKEKEKGGGGREGHAPFPKVTSKARSSVIVGERRSAT